MSGTETTRSVEESARDDIVSRRRSRAEGAPRGRQVGDGDVPLSPQWIPPRRSPCSARRAGSSTSEQIRFHLHRLRHRGGGHHHHERLRRRLRRCARRRQGALRAAYCPPAETLGEQQTNPTSTHDYDSADSRWKVSTIAMAVGGVTAVVFGTVGAVFAMRPIKGARDGDGGRRSVQAAPAPGTF